MFATDVAFPAEIRGNRFSGKSVDSPKTTRPPCAAPLLPPLSSPPPPPPPPQAVSAIAPVMPVAMSAAPRLVNLTCYASLVPRCGGNGPVDQDPTTAVGRWLVQAKDAPNEQKLAGTSGRP